MQAESLGTAGIRTACVLLEAARQVLAANTSFVTVVHLSLLFTLLTRAKDAVVVVAVDEGLVRHRLLGAHAVHHTLHKAKQQGSAVLEQSSG